MAKIIFGGSGFIGRNVQDPVDFVVSRRTAYGSNCVSLTKFSAAEINRVIHKCGAKNLLIALGKAHSRFSSEESYRAANNTIIKSIAEGARDTSVSHIVYLSTALLENTNMREVMSNYYLKYKYLTEQYLFEYSDRYGVPVTILRPSMVYGRGCRGLFSYMKKLFFELPGPLLNFGSGCRLSILHIDDLKRAIDRVFEHQRIGARIYTITNDCPVGVDDVIQGLVALRIGDGRSCYNFSVEKFINIIPASKEFFLRRNYSPRLFIDSYGWHNEVSLDKGLIDLCTLNSR